MRSDEAAKIIEKEKRCVLTDCERPECKNCGLVMGTGEILEALDMAISALKKQEADRWHSVAKEGNPKKSGLYIVTDNSKMDGNKPHMRWFNAYGKEEFWSGWGADKVVAWREITSGPYEAEEES